MEEVEADFLTFFHVFDIRDEPKLSGPRLVRLASQLPRYQGAVRSRLEYEVQNMQQPAGTSEEDSRFTPGESMSMGEALARSKGDEMAVLDSLSRESSSSGLGDLFEYEVG